MELVCARTAGRDSASRGIALYTWKDPLTRIHGVVAANETQARAILVATIILRGLFQLDEGATEEVDLLVRFVGRDAAAQEEVLRRCSGSYKLSPNLGFALAVCRDAAVVTVSPLSVVFKADQDNGCVVIGGSLHRGESKWATAAPVPSNDEGYDDDAAADDAADDAEAAAECRKRSRRARRARAKRARRDAGAAQAACAATAGE